MSKTKQFCETSSQNTVLRVIPTVTSYFVIVSDIPSGSKYGIYMFWQFFLWHSIWHSILTFYSGVLSGIYSGSLSDTIWHSFWPSTCLLRGRRGLMLTLRGRRDTYGTGLALVARLSRSYTHTHTTPSHTTPSHTTLSDTTWHNSFTHNFVTHTHNSFTHNFVAHNSFTRQLFHTQFFHTQLFYTQLCHTRTHNSFTHSCVTHNSVVTTLSHATLSHTQLCHTQLFHTQLCHTKLVCPHPFHTILSSTTLSHNLSSTISFVFPASPIPSSHLFCAYWKKLTCGVIRSFIFYVIKGSWDVKTSVLRMTFTWCNWLWWRVVDHVTIHNVPIHHKRIRSNEIDLEEGW